MQYVVAWFATKTDLKFILPPLGQNPWMYDNSWNIYDFNYIIDCKKYIKTSFRGEVGVVGTGRHQESVFEIMWDILIHVGFNSISYQNQSIWFFEICFWKCLLYTTFNLYFTK